MSKIPSLTRDALALSETIDALDDSSKAVACACVNDVIRGMKALGALPPSIGENVKDIVFTLIQKLVFANGNQGKIDAHLANLNAGITGALRKAIDDATRGANVESS